MIRQVTQSETTQKHNGSNIDEITIRNENY